MRAATATIVATLSAAKADGQLLVFEGNPLSVAAADRAKIDYFVLDTETTTDVTTLEDCRSHTPTVMRVSRPNGCCWRLRPGLRCMTRTVRSRRPFQAWPPGSSRWVRWRGLAAYDLHNDYYDVARNYPLLSDAIQLLNPSK